MKLSVQRPSIQWILMAALSVALPVFAPSLSAQAPPAEIPVLDETIDVRVVNVEAVVMDASGKRVRGLSAGDFRLLIDGQEVPVEYFTEVEEGRSVGTDQPAAPDAAPKTPVSTGDEVGRSYLIYVDDSFSLLDRRNDLLAKLERDLTLLRPADQMAVLAFDGSHIDLLCGWTGEVGKLRNAFERARQRPAQGGQMLAYQRALQVDVDWVDTHANSIDTGESNRVGGPKVHEVEQIQNEFAKRISPEARTQLGKTAASAAAALRGFETPPGRKVLLLLSGAWSLSVDPYLYSPFVEAANRLGYTVYPVDASQSDATEVTMLDRLARMTGGRVVVSAANDAFREVVADSGSYYWLGVTPFWRADDLTHNVTVEVRRPDLTVRSRIGFTDPSRSAENARKAESVLLFGGAKEQQRLIVQLGEPRRKGRVLELPVTLGVPVEALALRPEGTGYRADVPLAVAVQDKTGRRYDPPAMLLQVTLKTLPQAGTYARFQAVFDMRDIEQRLIFAVQDPATGKTLWGQADLVPSRQ